MDGIDALVNAVKRIASGDLYYSSVVLARIRLEPDNRGPQETRLGALTPREREVLVMLAKGSSVRGVAAALNLSYKTVDKHKSAMMKKLDIHDRVALCRYAVREHLIEA